MGRDARGPPTERYVRLLHGGAVDAVLVSGLRADVDNGKPFADPRVPAIVVNRRPKGAERWVVLEGETVPRMFGG